MFFKKDYLETVINYLLPFRQQKNIRTPDTCENGVQRHRRSRNRRRRFAERPAGVGAVEHPQIGTDRGGRARAPSTATTSKFSGRAQRLTPCCTPVFAFPL